MQNEEFQKKSHDLAVCPFCGGEAVISCDTEATIDTQGRMWAFTAVCNSCCATSGLCYSVEMAIKQWNTRKPLDDIVERLEELKAKPTELCYDVPLIESIIKIVKGEV